MRRFISIPCTLLLFAISGLWSHAATPVDVTHYDPACGVKIEAAVDTMQAAWNSADGACRISLNLAPGARLISSIDVAPKGSAQFAAVLENADIEFPITVGTRKPPQNQEKFQFVFFDKPFGRAHEAISAKLEKKNVRVESSGTRATIRISTLTAGPFSGDWVLHLYAGSPLIHVEAALVPTGKNIAYIYDALLAGGIEKLAYEDLDGQIQSRALSGDALTPLAVRYRVVMGQSKSGTVALFPPPHAFFFPRDRTDNYSFTQFDKTRFGLRQDPSGGGGFVPWIDAPEGKAQRMELFLVASLKQPKELLEQVKRYTHDDTFVPIDEHLTFTSHYHSRLTVGQLAGKSPVREFAYVFKKMGVQIVHLAEFHGDGHADDAGPQRLSEMKTMFELCATYSDGTILLLPGEEGNKYLGHPWPAAPKIHPGHWMYLFPKPVYLTWVRAEGTPYSEQIAPYGNVYHIGSREDMVQLLKDEKGLAWTTHPRIKASFATPDAFKDQDFYKSGDWLGGAWKAMPADLSEDRLGRRCLDVLDDMSNWATAGNYPLKSLPGEVDVFEIDRNHELYGHMNINYLKLAKLPAVGDGAPVIDALQKRDFFTTTGEVLIREFSVKDGAASFKLDWTFPLAYAELITGDGSTVKKQRIAMAGVGEFGTGAHVMPLDDKTAKWVRLEVVDIARNTAYTQAIEIK